jgi:hypothetical protein
MRPFYSYQVQHSRQIPANGSLASFVPMFKAGLIVAWLQQWRPKTMKNRGIYEKLNRRKDKGRNALTSQPFSQFSPITEQIDHDKL